MKALIIGYWSGGGTATQMMAHERGVRASLLATAPENTTADIVLIAGNPNADNEPDLKARIDFGDANLIAWIADNNDYDVVCYAYTGQNLSTLSPITEQLGIQLFCAMPNSGDYTNLVGISGSCDGVAYNDVIRRLQSNIFLIGGGNSENVASTGEPITAFTQALDKGSPNTTSWTTGAASGHYLNYIALGLTQQQARKAFIQSCSLYPNFTNQNGYGAVATTYSIPASYDNFGIVGWDWYRMNCNELQISVTPMWGEVIDEYRVYVDGSIVYSGDITPAGLYYGTSIRRVATVPFFESGDYELTVSAVVDGVELFSYPRTVTMNVVDPEPQPIPPPPEPEPEPEPIFPVILTGVGYQEL